MKKLFFVLICLMLLFFSACKKITNTSSYEKLYISGPADTVIVYYDSVLQYNATPFATWKLSDTSAGKIDASGKFKASSTDGVYKLIASNTLLVNDTIIKTIVVTKHAKIFNEMKSGGYLLSFKYADANSGADQTASTIPNWWKSCDAAVARQLTDSLGYRQSDSIGKVLKLLKLSFDTTMSSEYCRCKQTLQYFNLNLPNKEVQALTYLVYNEATRYTNTMNLYAGKSVNSKNYISVTHSNFTVMPTIAPLNSLNNGDCAVFKLKGNGIQPNFESYITLADWVKLAKK